MIKNLVTNIIVRDEPFVVNNTDKIYPLTLILNSSNNGYCKYIYTNIKNIPNDIKPVILGIVNKIYDKHIRYKILGINEPIYQISITDKRPRLSYSYNKINNYYITTSVISYYNRGRDADTIILDNFVNRIYLESLIKFPHSCANIVINKLVLPHGIDVKSYLSNDFDSLNVICKSIQNLENVKSLEMDLFSSYRWMPKKLILNNLRYIDISRINQIENLYFGDGCNLGVVNITECNDLKTIRLCDSVLGLTESSIKKSVLIMSNWGLNSITAKKGSPLVGMSIENHLNEYITITEE